ncbi:hypothetical protein ACB098_02G007600 [Castanea mollissima]
MGMEFSIWPFLIARVIAFPLVAATDAPPLSLPSSSMSAESHDVPQLDGIRISLHARIWKASCFLN